MTIHSISTDGDTVTIISDSELFTYQGMSLVALPNVMGMYAYNAVMDSIDSILANKAVDTALNTAIKAV